VEQYKRTLTHDERLSLFRFGIPDNNKRKVILKMLALDGDKCYREYEAVNNLMSADFKQFTHQMKVATSGLHFHFLTEHGEQELNFMLLCLKEHHGLE